MCSSRRRSSGRGRLLAALAGAGVTVAVAFAPGAAGGVEPPRSVLAQDGHAWRALTEGEKLAFLAGFLIGGALEHAMRLGPGETVPTPDSLEALRREGRLRFPFAPAVYKARLEDFYFYQDRLPVPLYRALLLINEQIRQGGR